MDISGTDAMGTDGIYTRTTGSVIAMVTNVYIYIYILRLQFFHVLTNRAYGLFRALHRGKGQIRRDPQYRRRDPQSSEGDRARA